MLNPKQKKTFLIIFFFIVIPILVFNPNPFGNSPDAVGDESLFLTSALSAIKHKTLPGWEFSASGSFYGGIQVYLDTLILIPAIAILRLYTGDALLTQLTVALHTGELLHLLRIVNGLVLLTLIGAAGWIYLKKKMASTFWLQTVASFITSA